MTKLYEAHNHILIHAGYANPMEHRHMAAHIIVAIDGKMRVMSNGIERICQGILIPSGVPHMVDTYGKNVLVFLYDCTTNVAMQIKNIQCISESCCNSIAELYVALDREYTIENYCSFEKKLLTQLDLSDPILRISDERVVLAMKYIRSMFSEEVSCQDIADAVHLSPGRFSHLFKEQVGMTFASYLVYQRIMYVYARTLKGTSITEAALEAGFSSSSHFADVNRRVFGISASKITHDLTFIKVY